MTDIGAELARMRKDLDRLQRAARLGYASLDDTAIEVRDGNGSLRGIVGQQGDGTTAVNIVNGGPPPAPATPTAAPALGGISAGWDGAFSGGAVIPLDWARVEVHASPTTGFTPGADTLKATIETAQGGIVYIPSTVPLYVKLLARNTSGTASPETGQVGPYAPRPVAGDIGIGEITETLIADGSITTPKVYAQAITAALLAVGSVDATALKADAITGKTITGGTINGTDINGATITGGTVQTGTTGVRVVLTPTPPAPLVQRPTMLLYSGATDEISPGVFNSGVISGSGQPNAVVSSPATAVNSLGAPLRSQLTLNSPNPGTRVGQFFLQATSQTNTPVGYANVSGVTATDANGASFVQITTKDGDTTPKLATFTVTNGRVVVDAEAFQVVPIASTIQSAIYVNSPSTHTGNLIRLQHNAVDAFVVDNTGNTTVNGNVTVAGKLTAGNIATGTTSVTPSAAYTPTSTTVFYTVTGTTFLGYATLNTTVPGYRTPATPTPGQGVTGVSVSSVTSGSMLVWVNRENTTATNVNWMVISA